MPERNRQPGLEAKAKWPRSKQVRDLHQWGWNLWAHLLREELSCPWFIMQRRDLHQRTKSSKPIERQWKWEAIQFANYQSEWKQDQLWKNQLPATHFGSQIERIAWRLWWKWCLERYFHTHAAQAGSRVPCRQHRLQLQPCYKVFWSREALFQEEVESEHILAQRHQDVLELAKKNPGHKLTRAKWSGLNLED